MAEICSVYSVDGIYEETRTGRSSVCGNATLGFKKRTDAFAFSSQPLHS
jgi:hypothetical protein